MMLTRCTIGYGALREQIGKAMQLTHVITIVLCTNVAFTVQIYSLSM